SNKYAFRRTTTREAVRHDLPGAFLLFLMLRPSASSPAHGLRIFDVEELWTHGGSLRVYLAHVVDAAHPTLPSVGLLLGREIDVGLRQVLAVLVGVAVDGVVEEIGADAAVV